MRDRIMKIVRQMHSEAAAEMAQAARLNDCTTSTQKRMARQIGNWATAIEQAINEKGAE